MFIFYLVLSNILIFTVYLFFKNFNTLNIEKFFNTLNIYNFFNKNGLLFITLNDKTKEPLDNSNGKLNFKLLYSNYTGLSNNNSISFNGLKPGITNYLAMSNMFYLYLTPVTGNKFYLYHNFFIKNININKKYFDSRSYVSNLQEINLLPRGRLFTQESTNGSPVNNLYLNGVKSHLINNAARIFSIKSVASSNKYIKSINPKILLTKSNLLYDYSNSIVTIIQNKYKESAFGINYFSTTNVKSLSPSTLSSYVIYFLRRSKILNKGRYSRNRQTCRVIVYWCFYLSIIAFIGLYYWFYHFVLNFGYLWWGFAALAASFFVPKATKFRLYNPRKLFSELLLSVKWVSTQLYFILALLTQTLNFFLKKLFYLTLNKHNYGVSNNNLNSNSKTTNLNSFFKDNNMNITSYSNFLTKSNDDVTSKSGGVLFLTRLLSGYKTLNLDSTRMGSSRYLQVSEYLQISYTVSGINAYGTNTSGPYKLLVSYLNIVVKVVSYLLVFILFIYIWVFVSSKCSYFIPTFISLNISTVLGLFFYLNCSDLSFLNSIKLLTLANYNNIKVGGNELSSNKINFNKLDQKYFLSKKYGPTWTSNEYAPIEYLNFGRKFAKINTPEMSSNWSIGLNLNSFNDTLTSISGNNLFNNYNNYVNGSKVIVRPFGYKNTFNFTDHSVLTETLDNPSRVLPYYGNVKKTLLNSSFKKSLDIVTQDNLIINLKNSTNSTYVSNIEGSMNPLNKNPLILNSDNSYTNNTQNLDDLFLLRNSGRLSKFFIESTFTSFKGNDWLYFSMLPEKYQHALYKYNLFVEWVCKDTSNLNNFNANIDFKVSQLAEINKIDSGRYVKYRMHDIYSSK